MTEKLKRTTVWIEESTLRKIEKLAKREERTLGWIIRKILAKGTK